MKLEEIAKALPETKLLFWTDPYQTRFNSAIQKVQFDEKSYYYVTLDRTLFYPKGGGQPSDRGMLIGSDFKLNVRKAMLANGVVVHWCKLLEGKPFPSMVVGEIDWALRYLLMRRHTAAHLFDHCLAESTGKRVENTDSWLGDSNYIGYKGKAPTDEELKKASNLANDTIQQGAIVSIRFLEQDSTKNEFSNVARFPLEKTRLVTISGCESIPCGGTHVRDVAEIGHFTFLGCPETPTGFSVFFDVG